MYGYYNNCKNYYLPLYCVPIWSKTKIAYLGNAGPKQYYYIEIPRKLI